MSWTSPADLQAQVWRLWERGDLLRAAIDPAAIVWPLRLSLKTPATADLTDRFDAIGPWISSIASVAQIRMEWREWTHRVQGRQRLPCAAWIDASADALAIIDKVDEAARYQTLWHLTAARQPDLLPWLAKRPLQALALAEVWERLLAVVAWMQARPRPGVYLRQVDVPGVDTKFIEAHRGTLVEWLDLALPPEAIDATASGVLRFAERYGFLQKPVRIRFRLLDPDLPSLPGCAGLSDVTLDAQSFAALALPVERMFITENETNFLAFPCVARSIVVFGAGYGWDALSQAAWMHQCRLHYWGDIDTHGFDILNNLRVYFPHVASFLMDRQTMFAHRAHWGYEPKAARHDLVQLTDSEAALYDELRFDRIQSGLRLEQERIGYGWLLDHLHAVVSTGLGHA